MLQKEFMVLDFSLTFLCFSNLFILLSVFVVESAKSFLFLPGKGLA